MNTSLLPVATMTWVYVRGVGRSAAGLTYFVDQFVSQIGLSTARAHGMLPRIVEYVGRDADSLDATRAARGLRMPALIMHDPRDPVVAYEYGRAIADAWAGSRLVPCEGMGHFRALWDTATIETIVRFVLDPAAG